MQMFRVLPEIIGSHQVSVKKKKEKIPSLHKRGFTIPVDTILSIRKASEIDRTPSGEIFKLFPELSKTYIRSILSYELRANLRVRPI